jgi:hypothetical protein
MRYLFSSIVFLVAGAMAITALADDEKEAKKDDGGPRLEIRERVVKEFDKDGDGKLNDEERDAAREQMREFHQFRRGPRGEDGGPKEGRGPGRGAEGRRGPEGHPGPEGGPDGPPKLPKPEELFDKFDKDKDGKLSKDEFKELAEFVHEHMPRPGRPPGPPPGGHFVGRIEGHFEPGPEGPRGENYRFQFRGPGGPPRGGDDGDDFRRPGPPGPPPGDGPRGDGPRRERRFDRERRGGPRGEGADRDRAERRSKEDKDDDDEKEDTEKDKAAESEAAI